MSEAACRGADSQLGQTALILAAGKGQVAAIELLMDRGANIESTTTVRRHSTRWQDAPSPQAGT